jgi:ComF family protein
MQLGEAERFCPACLEGFEVIEEPVCSLCGYPVRDRPVTTDSLCPGCLSKNVQRRFSCSVRSIALYKDKVREAILRVKYGRQAPVARSLGLFIRDHYNRFFPTEAFERIVPVPLHPKRLRAREFNQCVVLARPLARHLGIPLDLEAVERVRHSLPQSSSTEAERRRNLKGAFRVRKSRRIQRQSILLFDDVTTTGATLEAMARTLLTAGASGVAALTLARSPNPGD